MKVLTILSTFAAISHLVVADAQSDFIDLAKSIFENMHVCAKSCFDQVCTTFIIISEANDSKKYGSIDNLVTVMENVCKDTATVSASIKACIQSNCHTAANKSIGDTVERVMPAVCTSYKSAFSNPPTPNIVQTSITTTSVVDVQVPSRTAVLIPVVTAAITTKPDAPLTSSLSVPGANGSVNGSNGSGNAGNNANSGGSTNAGSNGSSSGSNGSGNSGSNSGSGSSSGSVSGGGVSGGSSVGGNSGASGSTNGSSSNGGSNGTSGNLNGNVSIGNSGSSSTGATGTGNINGGSLPNANAGNNAGSGVNGVTAIPATGSGSVGSGANTIGSGQDIAQSTGTFNNFLPTFPASTGLSGNSVVLILSAIVAFAVADTCTSITGASISILYPAQNQTVNVGDNLHIVWNYNNQVPSFSNVTLKFSIATAANANNAIPLVSLTTTKPA
ncbi:hypothetical protein HDU79_012030, partial [Rhizoclosmatium sp. JEL0117]